MSIVKGTLIAIALAFASATPTLAADGGRDDGVAWLLNPGPSTANQTAIRTARARAIAALPRRRATAATDTRGSKYQMVRDMNMSGV